MRVSNFLYTLFYFYAISAEGTEKLNPDGIRVAGIWMIPGLRRRIQSMDEEDGTMQTEALAVARETRIQS